MIEAVIFDLGGVLTDCPNTGLIRTVIERHGLRYATLSEHANDLAAYDRGEIGLDEFYRRCYPQIDDSVAHRLAEADLATYLTRNEDEIARLIRLHEDGMKVAVVSSVNAETAPLFRERFADAFAVCDAVLLSGETGIEKPSEELVAELNRRLDVPIDRMLFIDDDPECLDFAARCGAKTELYRKEK